MKSKLAQTFALLIAGAAAGSAGTYYYDEYKPALMEPKARLLELRQEQAEIIKTIKDGARELSEHDARWKPVHTSAIMAEKSIDLLTTAEGRVFADIDRIETAGPMPTPEPAPDPTPDPEPEPEPDPEVPWDVHVIYIDGPDGDTAGDDARDALIPETAVATIDRARIIAWNIIQTDKTAVVSFRFRRGDTFPAFGEIRALDPGWIDQPNDWRHTRLRGSDEQPLVITGYGEGPRPIFDGTGNAFAWQREQSNIELRGIEVHGGRICHARGWGRNIKIINCIGRDASILIQADGDKRLTNLEVRNCVIRDVLSSGPHAQGMFINRVDNWTIADCVFYRCGWYINPAEAGFGSVTDVDGVELGVSIFNHGVYVTGECSPGDCLRNVFIFCSGTGIQQRPGGNCIGNFVAWGARNGINWGATWGANSDDIPGRGDVTGNVIFNDTGLGGALTIGDIGAGRVADNLIVGGSMGIAVDVTSTHGLNSYGGWWFGINNLTIENNRMVGGMRLNSDGWGKLPEYDDSVDTADGLLVRNNVMTGKVDRDTDNKTPQLVYADPDGKVVIENEAEQVGQSVNVTPPVMDAATIDALLSREKTAADMISEVMN